MSHLNKIVRRVLLEEKEKDPSYWSQAGETLDKYGNAIKREGERWADAASELGSDIATGASRLAKATLDTFVGQAHAPESEDDVMRARASRVTLPDLVLPAIGDILLSLGMTRFRIAAKLVDAVGLPAKDIVARRYGKDFVNVIFTGSVLHDVLLVTSFAPGGIVPSMLLDSVVYMAEGDRKGAIATLALAGVFHAGGKVTAAKMDDAARGVIARKGGMEILAPKRYTDLSGAAKKGFTHAVPEPANVTAVVKFVEDVGRQMVKAGVKDGAQIAASAATAVRSGAVSIEPAMDAARCAEAQSAATTLMTRGPGGETPLVAARRIKNDVTVRKPVELPAEDRAGLDWLESLGSRVPLDTPEATALGTAAYDARWVYKDRPTPENKLALDKAQSAYYQGGFRDLKQGEIAQLQGSSQEKLMQNPKNVMSTPAFTTTAKRLFSKLGYDVNIIPIVGSHEKVFDKYLARYPKYLTGTEGAPRQAGVRVVVVPYSEGRAILSAVEGVDKQGGMVVGKTKVDTAPWMISHGIFDSAAGSLLVKEGTLPMTKDLVTRIEQVFQKYENQRMAFSVSGGNKGDSVIEYSNFDKQFIDTIVGGRMTDRRLFVPVSDPRVQSALRKNATKEALGMSVSTMNSLGIAVNSGWGANTRELLSDIMSIGSEIGDLAAQTGVFVENGFDLEKLALAAESQGIMKASEVEAMRDKIDDLLKRAAPMIGKKVEKGTGAGGQPTGNLSRTKQGVQNVTNYTVRGNTDHIAEIMTDGYSPDLSYLQTPGFKYMLGEQAVALTEKAAKEIADILGENGQNAKDAFAEDMKGNVLFVFPD
jgi:hypothetical protein